MPELLADFITGQAERCPEAVAVVGSDDTLTYARLEGLSNQLARILKDGGAKIDADGFEGTRICCAYVPQPETEVTAIGLRQALGKVMPPYMVPSLWLAFDTLPKNASGKIDRNTLTAHFLQHRPAPRAGLL